MLVSSGFLEAGTAVPPTIASSEPTVPFPASFGGRADPKLAYDETATSEASGESVRTAVFAAAMVQKRKQRVSKRLSQRGKGRVGRLREGKWKKMQSQ